MTKFYSAAMWKDIFFYFIRNLKPKEIVYAMKTLGVAMTVEQCVTYIEKESRDTL